MNVRSYEPRCSSSRYLCYLYHSWVSLVMMVGPVRTVTQLHVRAFSRWWPAEHLEALGNVECANGEEITTCESLFCLLWP
jgi:hypothetical protein